jgi:hypothetical protein
MPLVLLSEDPQGFGGFLVTLQGRVVTRSGRKFDVSEAFAKFLKAVENRHSGQAKRDPESRIFKRFWIPAFAGMTE